jgi:hypothetical protein
MTYTSGVADTNCEKPMKRYTKKSAPNLKEGIFFRTICKRKVHLTMQRFTYTRSDV